MTKCDPTTGAGARPPGLVRPPTNRRRDLPRAARRPVFSKKWIAFVVAPRRVAGAPLSSKMLARAVRNGEFDGQGPQVLGVDVKVRGSSCRDASTRI